MKNSLNNRCQRRICQRQMMKAFNGRKFVPANDAFNRIKSELTDFGWIIEEHLFNTVEIENKLKTTESTALMLYSNVLHITLIPHSKGIEISRLEVYKDYRRSGCAGKALKSILNLLIKNSIDDIFLIPMTAGKPENLGPTSLSTPELQRFYFKRGFRKIPNNPYWKLDIAASFEYIQDTNDDFESLKVDYTPQNLEVSRKSLSEACSIIPIKMKVYNRA